MEIAFAMKMMFSGDVGTVMDGTDDTAAIRTVCSVEKKEGVSH